MAPPQWNRQSVSPSKSWSSRRRIPEDIDELETCSSEARLSQTSASRARLVTRKVHQTATCHPKPASPSHKHTVRSLSSKSRSIPKTPASPQLQLMSAASLLFNKGSARELNVAEISEPSESKLAADTALESLDTNNASTFDNAGKRCDSVYFTNGGIPEARNHIEVMDAWVEETDQYEHGQYAVHNGRAGRWQNLGPDPFTGLKIWDFVPESLLSRPKERVSRHKKKAKPKVTILSLPGELRNEVYKYVIPECRMLIVRTRPNKELEERKKIWSEQGVEQIRQHARLTHLLDLDQKHEGLGITMNLLLACKQVRNDIELYLYSRTTFCFSSTRILDWFLCKASKPGLRAIRSLEILHKGYGNPELADHQKFRQKYYDRWARTCRRIGEELWGLERLKLESYIRDWPCELSALAPNTAWRKACLLMAPRRLPKVEVRVYHSMIHHNNMVLKELARDLENDMMTQKGQDERDRLETVRVLTDLAAKKATREARRKARQAKLFAPETPSELIISKEDIRNQKPTPVKVRKEGLDKYSRVDTVNMCEGELYYFNDQYRSERHKIRTLP